MDPQRDPLAAKTSFYFPFLFLPKEKRQAMEVLYRYFWTADEVSDAPGTVAQKRARLRAFNRELEKMLAGKPEGPLFTQLSKIIDRFQLSPQPLRFILKGLEQDIRGIHFKRFAELQLYALQVAGTPGQSSMELFGFHDAKHLAYAENLALFLQLTNIVRDFKEDFQMDRRYLPTEDFKKFDLDPADWNGPVTSWLAFFHYQLERAWSYWEKACQSLSYKERGELTTAEAIASVYIRLYRKLSADPLQTLQGRVRVSGFEKLLAALGTAIRCAWWRLIG